ncbi:MAG: M28 family peptidase [Cyclobacteriaceae bacterium]|jgi:hypothetical protein|nr:M28 family peptidase [Cyclobacteriaceae bacterium]
MNRIVAVAGLVLWVAICQAQHLYSTDRLFQDLKILAADSMEGRKTSTPGNFKARNFLISRLKDIQVKPLLNNYEQPFTITRQFGMLQSGDGVNILGVIDGQRKETIVISAHYDHVGVMRQNIYNGADDNASGAAALLAIADYFKRHKPRHRLILAFFDAEEIGLKGSEHFVRSVDLAAEKIVLNINMDMISRSEIGELYICGTSFTPSLRQALAPLKVPEKMLLRYGHDDPASGRNDWTNQSDHYNFHRQRIPFLYFGVEDHPDYHQPTDTVEKIDLDFYKDSVETILQAIQLLDNSLTK